MPSVAARAMGICRGGEKQQRARTQQPSRLHRAPFLRVAEVRKGHGPGSLAWNVDIGSNLLPSSLVEQSLHFECEAPSPTLEGLLTRRPSGNDLPDLDANTAVGIPFQALVTPTRESDLRSCSPCAAPQPRLTISGDLDEQQALRSLCACSQP
jgi:hypothetical protein